MPLLVLVPVYGLWVVTNGGNAEAGVGMSNYANAIFPPDNYTDPSMAYAVDLQEITIRGNLSSQGPHPDDFRVYEALIRRFFHPARVKWSLSRVEILKWRSVRPWRGWEIAW